jgi:hypothetical protein
MGRVSCFIIDRAGGGVRDVSLFGVMRLTLAGLVVAMLLGRVAWAQIDARAMEHDLKGKPRALRSYLQNRWRGMSGRMTS